MSMSDIVWSEPLISELRELWRAGKTASECATTIAQKFRVFASRSAIIGEAHRLGLSGRQSQNATGRPHIKLPKLSKPPVEKATTRKVQRAVKMGNHFKMLDGAELSLPKALPAANIPIAQRKTLIELTNKTCRWPYGDPGTPDFFFCGAPEADFAARVPYCQFHTAFACGRIRAPAIVPGEGGCISWEPATFLIAAPAGPVEHAGYTYRALGLHRKPSKGRHPAHWSLIHLGTGHSIITIIGPVATVFPIATEIAECADWDFDGLDGWRNRDPAIREKLKGILARHPAKYFLRPGGVKSEAIAAEIARARA